MGALGENTVILFLDECSVQLAATITRVWALKGHQPQILTPGGRKRQQLVGVVDPVEGQLIVAFSDSLKATQFQHFLEGVLKRYSRAEKVIIVLDNARAHHAKALEPFLKEHEKRLELLFLPPYSPKLNPIERLWKKMRKSVTHNTYFETFTMFQAAIIRFFRKLRNHPEEIKSLCCIH